MSQDKTSKSLNTSLFSFNRSSIFVYFLLIPSLIAYHAFSRAKLIYFIPAVMLVLFLLENQFNQTKKKGLSYEPNMLVSLALYVVLILLSLAINYSTIHYNILIRDILIILSPLIVFSMKMTFDEKHIKWLFVATIISYFAWVGFVMEFDFSFSFIRSNYNLSSEFHNGVIIGCFFLFFLDRKKFLWAAIALLLILMSGKRSIILGILPALATYYFIIKPFRIHEKKYLLSVLLLLYFLAFYIVGVNLDSFANWVLDITNLDKETSLDRFLMGRQIFITYLKDQIAHSDLLNYLFGYGPGEADIFIHDEARPDWGSERRESTNPHNDFLKLRFDYGLIGSLLMFIVFYSSYARTKMGIQMFLYTIPLFLVDNSFIFIYYWFIALTVARFEENENIQANSHYQ